jgi:CheY-like chemotaxis protein
MGIPPPMLRKIFDMFTQVGGTSDHAQGGLGIGLTLVKRLVELHGGHIEARSEGENKGSEFVVTMPRTSEAAANEDHADDGEAAPRVNPRRILVVDDNRDAAESLSMLLHARGHDVQVAYDGLEAVGAAIAFNPDVVLLDIGLPKLHGYDAARRIRDARGDKVLLIAVTGWGQDEDRKKSRNAGFDHHLTKPVDPEAISRIIDETYPAPRKE